MTPTKRIGLRISHAKAVATGLREAAGYCVSSQNVLRARLEQAAQTIDEMVELLEQTEFVARMNHDVIVARAR